MPPLNQDQPDELLASFPPPRVVSIGRSIFDPIWAQNEHAGKSSEVLHVIRGSVDQVTSAGTVEGEEQDTIYTPQGTPHRDVFPPNTTFEVYLICFTWKGESALLKRYTPAQLTGVGPEVKSQISADFRQLYRDFERGGKLAQELASLRLLQIILTLCREAERQSAPSDDAAQTDKGQARRLQIMAQARQVIQTRFHEPLSLEAIASALHISPYHLSHVFSAESGFTLSSYLTSVRMEKATQLLKGGKHTISEVAAAVGFRDPHYFSRVFRSYSGQAPSAYRVRPFRKG